MTDITVNDIAEARPFYQELPTGMWHAATPESIQ